MGNGVSVITTIAVVANVGDSVAISETGVAGIVESGTELDVVSTITVVADVGGSNEVVVSSDVG
jgi:hypothetical protein